MSRSFPGSALLAAYRALAPWFAPLWARALERRRRRGKESAQSVAEKLARSLPERPQGTVIWGHAVGVGETLALAGIFARLGEALPDCSFVITSIARSSHAALHGAALPPRTTHQFAPIDTPQAVATFLDHWRPALAVWCELDLWPVTIAETAARRIPMALLNVRYAGGDVFDRWRGKRLARGLYRALLARFEAIYVQNAASAAVLHRLGIAAERLRVAGNVKALAPGLRCDSGELQRLGRLLGTRPRWLLASSHAGEEVLALAAHERLRQQQPEALLVIVPRYVARGAEIAGLAKAALRSAGALPRPEDAVYVADTMGELGLWYRLCPVALVGGSLVPVGGHNPWEASALGCRVLYGEHVANFSEAYETLSGEGRARRVDDAGSIADQVEAVWAGDVEGGPTAAGSRAGQAVDVVAELAALLATGDGKNRQTKQESGKRDDG